MLKYLALSGMLLFLACSTQKQLKDRLWLGMTHERALRRIHDRSELIIAEFTYPRGHLVTYQYSLVGTRGPKQDRYYLYFMNDSLIRKSSPEDPQQGANIAVKEYYGK